jgi:hypothetical protein
VIEGFGTEVNHTDMIVSTNNNFGGSGMGSMTGISNSTLVIGTATISKVTNTCSQTVGINEFNFYDIWFYPNPSRDEITIENFRSDSNNYFELMNMLGQKQNLTIGEEKGNSILNISELPTGIYFLNVRSDKGNITKRIIKVN